jgi:3-dehydroquinate synthetase
MLHDKKMAAGTLPFLLARGIGQTFLDKTVDLARTSPLPGAPHPALPRRRQPR